MSHIHSQSEQMSLCSIPALQFRHDSISIPSSHLGASLLGTAAACLEIGHRIKHNDDFATANRCIVDSLLPLADELYGMHFAFRDIQRTWSHPISRTYWTESATTTVKHVQDVVQEVASGLRDMTHQCKAWDVVVPERVYYDIQEFIVSLQRQQLILNLLVLIMYVLSPSEGPNMHGCCYQEERKETESEKFSNACQYLASTVRIRSEIKEKLLKIASIDPEQKTADSSTSPQQISDADDWSCTESTWDIMTPTGDWCDCASDVTRLGSMPGDYSLEAMLDGFGHEGMRDTFWPVEAIEARRRDLAKLTFHWTNVETFAGIKRGDMPPARQPFHEDLSHLPDVRKFRW